MTQHFNQTASAYVLADQTVKDRFGAVHDTDSLSSYFDFVDARQTGHLSEGAGRRASAQRKDIKIAVENAGTLIAKIPMKDPRRTGAIVWAEIELGILFDLLENGADGAWCINYARKEGGKGYVKTAPPLAKQGTATGVTLGRLVAGAGKGSSVRFLDRNPLNLRRSNLFLCGNPSSSKGPAKGSKHDARALMREKSLLRSSLAGANYGRPGKREE